ncbi:hypothetical protein LJR175_006737 [Variovorax sp. LjRoot175]|uniref:hypothetical protein n=1 Tax=Variovorax sp. LjRoot175 TaxID=3342276 RepID=UPI003ECCC7BF
MNKKADCYQRPGEARGEHARHDRDLLSDLSHYGDPGNCTAIITWPGSSATLIRRGNIDTKPIMPSSGLHFMHRNMRFPRRRLIGNIDREAGTLSKEEL